MVLILMYVMSKESSVANTPAGGVSVAGFSSAVTPLPASGTLAFIVSVPVDTSTLIKKIVIVHDNAASIGEVRAYAGKRLLIASDFSDASPTDGHKYNSNFMLVLKDPIRLTRADVIYRQDCCHDRPDGASLMMYDSANKLVLKKTLRGPRELRLFPVRP